MKKCENCGEDYSPAEGQENNQKYCGMSCKDKAQYKRGKAEGHIRAMKSGYPRQVSIRLYMEARNSDVSAPCHYCKTRVYPDTFQIDHKIPMSRGYAEGLFKNKADLQNPDNLVISCEPCNRLKGNKYSYEEFIAIKQNAEI